MGNTPEQDSLYRFFLHTIFDRTFLLCSCGLNSCLGYHHPLTQTLKSSFSSLAKSNHVPLKYIQSGTTKRNFPRLPLFSCYPSLYIPLVASPFFCCFKQKLLIFKAVHCLPLSSSRWIQKRWLTLLVYSWCQAASPAYSVSKPLTFAHAETKRADHKPPQAHLIIIFQIPLPLH